MKTEKSIEEAILQLEAITKKIEEEDLPIDDVIKTYKMAIEMAGDIKKRVLEIKNQIEEIRIGKN